MNYYVPYKADVKSINLLYILYLYGIAEYNKDTKTRNTIKYNSIKEIKERINNKFNISLSQSTAERFINAISKSKEYAEYFEIDINNKYIIIKNNFKSKKNCSFVVLDERQYNFLTNSKNDFLCKYYLCLLYNCGKSKTNTIDSTAEQLLTEMGYSTKSGTNKAKLSEYNALLKENALIQINSYTDKRGYKRNKYSFA